MRKKIQKSVFSNQKTLVILWLSHTYTPKLQNNPMQNKVFDRILPG